VIHSAVGRRNAKRHHLPRPQGDGARLPTSSPNGQGAGRWRKAPASRSDTYHHHLRLPTTEGRRVRHASIGDRREVDRPRRGARDFSTRRRHGRRPLRGRRPRHPHAACGITATRKLIHVGREQPAEVQGRRPKRSRKASVRHGPRGIPGHQGRRPVRNYMKEKVGQEYCLTGGGR